MAGSTTPDIPEQPELPDGAAFGALFNRRETLRLGRAVQAGLLREPRARRVWD